VTGQNTRTQTERTRNPPGGNHCAEQTKCWARPKRSSGQRRKWLHGASDVARIELAKGSDEEDHDHASVGLLALTGQSAEVLRPSPDTDFHSRAPLIRASARSAEDGSAPHKRR